MPFEEKPITTSGMKTVYLEAGNGDILVWIPGWGASGKTYSAVFTILASKYHIFSPDLPGFGKAPNPQSIWNFSDYGEFVSTFIDQLDLKNVILIGHSTGGAVAIHTAIQNTKIKQLILIDPYGLPLGQSRIKLMGRYIREFFTELIETTKIRDFVSTSLNLLPILRNIKYTLPYTLHIFNEQMKFDETLFKRVRVPTLIIWGKNDRIFGKDYAQRMLKMLPDAEIKEVRGTHNWILFRPEELLKCL
jgi:pimeloyl-ACP methyl ester carboxylesterase